MATDRSTQHQSGIPRWAAPWASTWGALPSVRSNTATSAFIRQGSARAAALALDSLQRLARGALQVLTRLRALRRLGVLRMPVWAK
jgi:hypothetical protein